MTRRTFFRYFKYSLQKKYRGTFLKYDEIVIVIFHFSRRELTNFTQMLCEDFSCSCKKERSSDTA